MRFAGESSIAAGLAVCGLLVASAHSLAAPARSVTINGIAFVQVPAGPFTMGTPVEQCVRAHEAPGLSAEARARAREYCTTWESPPHQVTLPAFYIMRTEVTLAQYDRFVQATSYHPVYAFEFAWGARGKKAIVEIDAVTGDVRADGKAFHQQMRRILNREVLFDLGAETVNLLVPGGAIALKIGKAIADSQRGKRGN